MHFINEKVEAEFQRYFRSQYRCADARGLAFSLLSWFITLRRPGIHKLENIHFLLIGYTTVFLFAFLLFCLWRRPALYDRMRKPAMMTMTNAMGLGIATVNFIIEGAVDRGASEESLLSLLLMAKWPYLIAGYLCFTVPGVGSTESNFLTLLWFHFFAGRSYVPRFDKLSFVQASAKLVNGLLRMPLAGLASALVRPDYTKQFIDAFQVDGRQATILMWQVMLAAIFWTYTACANRHERRMREQFVALHVRDRASQLVAVTPASEIVRMLALELYACIAAFQCHVPMSASA